MFNWLKGSNTDNLKKITNALSSLIQRNNENAFVIFEEKTTKKYVQFAGSANEDLLLDLPFQTLSPVEVDNAKLLFEELGKSKPEKYALYTDKSLEIITGVQTSFQINFGRNVEQATKITLAIFERVYGFSSDFQLNIEEN